jgi:hypothetical protein
LEKIKSIFPNKRLSLDRGRLRSRLKTKPEKRICLLNAFAIAMRQIRFLNKGGIGTSSKLLRDFVH